MQPAQKVLEGIRESLTLVDYQNGLERNDCSECANTTWVLVPGTNRVRRCECQKRRIAESRIRTVLRDWPEYSGATLEDFKPRNVRQEHAATVIRGDPRGSYFLSGYHSAGKTHLMIAQYRCLALASEKCILRSARDLMEELRKAEIPAQSNEEVFESPVLQMVNLAQSGHLFIDDVEKAPARSEFRAEMLFDLLDTIKRRQLGITVTSNLRLEEFARKLPRGADVRIYRLCREIKL